MPKKLRVLQINKFFYLKGGTERIFFGLSEELEKRGHEIIYFSTKDKENVGSKYENYFAEKVELKKFNVKNIIKIFYNYNAVKNLEKLILAEKPDIAHLHNIYHQLSPAIIRVLKKNNIPIVLTLHDYKIICPNYLLFSGNKLCEKCKGGKYYECVINKCSKNSFLKSFLAMLEAYLHSSILKTYDNIDIFIAPSNFMKNKMVSFGVPKNKIEVIHNFTNIPNVIEKKDREENYVLYFGRLSSEKGVDVLIKAMKKINPGIKLKIIGAGPEYKKLKILIKRLSLQDRIELLGPKYSEDLSEIIKYAKAIIIPSSWRENMPLSAIEAIAMGKTIIASNIGGLPEIINNNVNGLLFEPGDEDDLAQKVNYYLKNQELKNKFYENNKVIFKDNFLPSSIIGKVESVYNKILANIK